jgi:uncharacterized protein (DUF427 family)
MSIPDWLKRAQEAWTHRGQLRPDFAEATGPGEESVWDYPRPPRLEADSREVRVVAGGVEIACTRRAMRLLETASPPTFYLPPDDVATEYFHEVAGSSMCEWKGNAVYWAVTANGKTFDRVAWTYPNAFPPYDGIRGWYCFYPSRVACFVDGEAVRPQAGDFYGGWITSEVKGPFKGDPGTSGW